VLDDGLDAQDAAELVVHLDPVGLELVLDPCPQLAVLEVGEQLALEGRGELLPEEGQDILGAQAHGGVLEQILVQTL
jgi:hypothetical protein